MASDGAAGPPGHGFRSHVWSIHTPYLLENLAGWLIDENATVDADKVLS